MTIKRREFVRNLFVGATGSVLLGACGGGGGDDNGDDPSAPGTSGSPDLPPRSLSFVLMGDTGTGTEKQYYVAQALEKLLPGKGCDFILIAGDNLYDEGATSVTDPKFMEKFELPYQNLDYPFYLCLGNHDCASTFLGGGAFNSRGDFQVAYTTYEDRYSNKWNMPARYYNKTFDDSQGAPFVELFTVDSNPLTSFFLDTNEKFSWANYGYPQQRWMRERVSSSRAHWKIAMSHVPYRSNGKHGNAGNLDPETRFLFNNPDANGQRYKLFLEECFGDKADMLLSGHDHIMQWLEPAPDMGRTQLIVSGAGGKADEIKHPDLNPVIYQKGDEMGFCWIHLTETEMTVEVYQVSPKNGDYYLAYAQTLAKPVTQEAAASVA